MKKIPTIYERDPKTGLVVPKISSAVQEMINEVLYLRPTRKFDGTCVKIEDGCPFRRYDAKHEKTPPEGFVPAQEPDPHSEHWPGWLLIDEHSPADQYCREAFVKMTWPIQDGTFELCGPKINANPERVVGHVLIRHGLAEIEDTPHPKNFEALREFLRPLDVEGIVWWRGLREPFAKIKKKDFGMVR